MKYVYTALLCVCLMAVTVQAEEDKGPDPLLSGVEVLELEVAQRIALRDNPDMGAALSRVAQARERIAQAAATWWPSLDLTGRVARTRRSDIAYDNIKLYPPSPGFSTDRTYDEGAAGIQASWLLFDGFLRTFRNRQAEYNWKSTRAARRDAQRLLLDAVAQAYLEAQLTQTRVKISRADETFYQSQLEDAQNRYDVGVGAWSDVLNIKVQLNSARTALMLDSRRFEAAGYGLAALMGLPGAMLPQGMRLADLDTEAEVRGADEDARTLIDEALAARPDIRRLELLKKEIEAVREGSRAPFYPRVELFGTLNGSRQGDVHLTGDDFGNSIGINMAWNLFAGGGDKARLAEAGQREREIAFQLASLKNQVASQVRQDLALLAAAVEQVDLQRQSVELVRENRDLTRSEYEAGEVSVVRLNEAQRNFITTYNRLAQALVSWQQARHRLLAVTGRNLRPFADLVETDAEEPTP